MDNPVLKAENICKAYDDGGRKIHVLENANLSVSAGEFVLILGPSGSGKSTFLNLAGMLDTPSSGAIYLDGTELTGLAEDEKAALRLAKIGFIFQFDSLLPEFTVAENADMPALLAGRPDQRKAVELLKRFGLEALAHKMPSDLSGGEKHRAAIARALRNGPRLILADEPTGNLDIDNARIVYEDFRNLSKTGVAVIMATHNQEAARYADKAYRLVHGGLAETGK